MKKTLFALVMTLASFALFMPAAFADEEEENPCALLAEGICELCGQDVCQALLAEEPPTEEECAQALVDIGQLAEEVEKLPEDAQEEVAVVFCEELAKGLAAE